MRCSFAVTSVTLNLGFGNLEPFCSSRLISVFYSSSLRYGIASSCSGCHEWSLLSCLDTMMDFYSVKTWDKIYSFFHIPLLLMMFNPKSSKISNIQLSTRHQAVALKNPTILAFGRKKTLELWTIIVVECVR